MSVCVCVWVCTYRFINVGTDAYLLICVHTCVYTGWGLYCVELFFASYYQFYLCRGQSNQSPTCVTKADCAKNYSTPEPMS